MLITQSNIAALQVGFKGNWRAGYSDASKAWADSLMMTVPANTATTTFGWSDRDLKMREWLGPRVLQNLRTLSQNVTVRPFEATVSVNADDIEDDALGIYSSRFEDIGRAARLQPSQRFKTKLLENPTCFDGQAFFSATHDLDPAGNQSNLLTSSALSDSNFNTAYQTMQEFTGGDGEPMGVTATHLFVGPQNRKTGLEIVSAERGAAGATNVNNGAVQLVVVPELSGSAWYLADLSMSAKPWVKVERRAPRLILKDGPTDDNMFWDKDVVFGVDSRMEVAPALWWLMLKCTA